MTQFPSSLWTQQQRAFPTIHGLGWAVQLFFVTLSHTKTHKYKNIQKKNTHTHRHTYSTENTAKESAKERMTETQQRKKKTDFEVGQIKDDTLYIVVFGSSVYAGIQYTVYASMFILGYSSRDINVFKSVFVYLLILPYACNLIF